MLKVSQPVSIIPDIVSEQAIDTMAAMINYKKFTYGSNKGAVEISLMSFLPANILAIEFIVLATACGILLQTE